MRSMFYGWLLPLAVLSGAVTATSVKAAELAQGQETAQSIQATEAIPVQAKTSDKLADATEVIKEIKDQQKTVGQVTSVSQLSDVQPTDWAFQALQSLVERYGCIAGYPDGTFKGNRAATRYELAAALNACLDQISDRFATKEDLATVKALQEEFKTELATLKGRVDGLEARTKTLEAQQFSTTTKLSGIAVFTPQYGSKIGSKTYINPIAGGSNLSDSRATMIGTVQLSFNTSFSGTDLLQTTLFVGNNGQDLIGAANVGSSPTNSGPSSLFVPGQYYWSGYPTSAGLYRLAYSFRPTKNLSVTVGPLFYPTDIIDANSFTGPATGFSSWFFINNPLITPYQLNFFGGAGVGFDWKIGGGPLSLRGVYNAASPVNSVANTFGGGLFGDPYQATGELEYANKFGADKKNSYAVRLQYTNSATSNISQNAGGLNAELNLGRFGVFARYGISGSHSYGGATPLPYDDFLGVGVNKKFLAQTWMVGAGVKDLFIPGSLLAIAGGQPYINDLGSGTSLGGTKINNTTQTNLEAFYRFPINDNISITPDVMVIFNPNNSTSNPTLIQGLIRVTFSF